MATALQQSSFLAAASWIDAEALDMLRFSVRGEEFPVERRLALAREYRLFIQRCTAGIALVELLAKGHNNVVI